MSLQVERSETKQSQGLGLLRTANNDGKYFGSSVVSMLKQ